MCSCCWMSQSSIFGPKEKTKEWEEDTGPLKCLAVTLAREVGLTTMKGGTRIMAVHLFVHLWSEIAIKDQSTDPRYLRNKVLYYHPCCHKPCTSCCRNTCSANCHKGEGWEMGSSYCAESSSGPKLIAIYHSILSPGICKLSIDLGILK